jgi:hypothetical protein
MMNIVDSPHYRSIARILKSALILRSGRSIGIPGLLHRAVY